MAYHVTKRRSARQWDILRKDAAGKPYRINAVGECLTRKEATSIARLLAGWGDRVVVHDRVYPVGMVFPDSQFALTHI